MTAPRECRPPRCGDVVRHIPSGEEWLVAWAEGDRLAWAGWPDGTAALSDCEVIQRVSDEGHRAAVQKWACVPDDTDSRPARVLRLYGHSIAEPLHE